MIQSPPPSQSAQPTAGPFQLTVATVANTRPAELNKKSATLVKTKAAHLGSGCVDVSGMAPQRPMSVPASLVSDFIYRAPVGDTKMASTVMRSRVTSYAMASEAPAPAPESSTTTLTKDEFCQPVGAATTLPFLRVQPKTPAISAAASVEVDPVFASRQLQLPVAYATCVRSVDICLWMCRQVSRGGDR